MTRVEGEDTIMKNHGVDGSKVDLHRFFEASVRALRDESASIETRYGRVRGNRALVQGKETDESLRKRAVADAAKALTALWKIRPVGKAI